MNNGILIWKKAKESIAEEYLQKVLAMKPNAIGIAAKHPTEGLVVQRAMDGDVPDLPSLMEMLENVKDFEAVLWLAHIIDNERKEENLQPFVLNTIDDKEEEVPLLALFAEGDYPKFSKPGEGITEEHNLVEKAIGPVLGDYLEITDGNIEMFLDKLNSEAFETNVSAHFGHRGAMLFFPKEGETVSIALNELGKEYAWGATSQHLGYDPDAVKQQEVAKKPKFSLLFGSKAKAETPPATPPEEKPVVPKADPAVEPAKTDTKISSPSVPDVKLKEELVYVEVDPKLDGKARKRFIRQAMGLRSNQSLPENWHRKDFKIPVASSKVKDFKTAGEVIKSRSTVREAAPTQTKSDLPLVPIIKDEHKTKVMDFVVAKLDINSKAIAGDPKTISKIEAMFPSFTETTGVDLESIFKLSYEQRLELNKLYPDIFTLLQMETESLYKKTLKSEDTAPKTTEEPVKTEEPVATPEPKKVAAAGGKKKYSW